MEVLYKNTKIKLNGKLKDGSKDFDVIDKTKLEDTIEFKEEDIKKINNLEDTLTFSINEGEYE